MHGPPKGTGAVTGLVTLTDQGTLTEGKWLIQMLRILVLGRTIDLLLGQHNMAAPLVQTKATMLPCQTRTVMPHGPQPKKTPLLVLLRITTPLLALPKITTPLPPPARIITLPLHMAKTSLLSLAKATRHQVTCRITLPALGRTILLGRVMHLLLLGRAMHPLLLGIAMHLLCKATRPLPVLGITCILLGQTKTMLQLLTGTRLSLQGLTRTTMFQIWTGEMPTRTRTWLLLTIY